MTVPALNLLDAWQPGSWCAAALKLCEQHVVEGEHEIERFPEQWMFVLWRPMDRAVPFVRPDCWGFTVGRPRDEVATAVGREPLYLLAEDECLWSAWIDMCLACDRMDPWFTALVQRRRDEQRMRERERSVVWYGNADHEFERFLGKLLPATDSLDPLINDSLPGGDSRDGR